MVRAKRPARVPVVLTESEVRALLAHKDVSTTMIYTHVLNKGGRGVRSPLDRSGQEAGVVIQDSAVCRPCASV